MILLLGLIPVSFAESAEKSAPKKRYTVLALEIAREVRFTQDGETIYKASSTLPYVKEAALRFLSELKSSTDENYVSLLVYFDTTMQTGFTDDLDAIAEQIGLLEEMGILRDLSGVFDISYELFEDVRDPDAEKNLVLVTTGMTDSGFTGDEGPFYATSPGGEWNASSGVPVYLYANGAIDTAERLKNSGVRIYTIGIFQTVEGMPEAGQGVAALFRETVRYVASDASLYPVEAPAQLEETFDEVAKIINNDGATPSEKPFQRGDVDFDGSVSAADARLALRRSVGLETYAEDSKAFLACDVDFNDAVTAADARLILRATVGLEDPAAWRK